MVGRKYIEKYTKEDIDRQSANVNISGRSPRDCLIIEEESQRKVAEHEKWLIAKKLFGEKCRAEDSRKELERLGFTVFVEYDDLFYSCIQPKGWEKQTKGYWTTIKDEKGVDRMVQFYKGAFYDRNAHINIIETNNKK